jgi:hypothetical protein
MGMGVMEIVLKHRRLHGSVDVWIIVLGFTRVGIY